MIKTPIIDALLNGALLDHEVGIMIARINREERARSLAGSLRKMKIEVMGMTAVPGLTFRMLRTTQEIENGIDSLFGRDTEIRMRRDTE
jgi:hypothetical protein